MSTNERRLCLFELRKLSSTFTVAFLTFYSSSLVMKGFLTAMSPFLERLGKKMRPEASNRSSFCGYKLFLSGKASSLSSTDAKRTPLFLF